MTEIETFAAERREVLLSTEERIRSEVEAAVESRDWAGVVAVASAVWLEVFREITEAQAAGFLEAFTSILETTLGLSGADANPEVQVDRLTLWVSTFTVNDATNAAASTMSLSKRWVTMLDDEVRETHRDVHGETRTMGSTFDVGGFNFHYPGEPVGPPNLWLNCRCVLQPFAPNVAAAAVVDEEVEEDEELEDEEDDLEGNGVIPCHGVLAPIGKPTGDGRIFAEDSITHRDLPLPMKWQKSEAEGHMGSVVVVTIRNIYVEDGLVRWDGDFVDSPEAAEVLGLIAQGALRGVSVDLDAVESVLETDDGERWQDSFYEDESKKQMMKVTKGRICAATIVPIPAFAEAYIEIGTREEALEASCIPCADRSLSAASLEPDTGAIVALLPSDDDPTVAASSEPAHLTTIWMGEAADLPDVDAIVSQVAEYAKQLEGPIEVPVKERGELGDDQADVVFLEPTESLLAVRNGLLEGSVKEAFDSVEQYDPWLPHVTLGYPETPAVGEYQAESVTFDRIAVWVGDDWFVYEFGGALAAATFAPGTKDGPGWITNPRATSRIRRYWTRGKGAAKIRWGVPGDFNRCRRQLAKYIQNPDWLAGTCANMHKEALGFWPGEHHSLKEGTTMSPTSEVNFVESEEGLAAAASPARPVEWFSDPGLKGPTPVTITDEGRIFGHIATWNTCHTGFSDKCVTAPRSQANYAHFRTGAVRTDAGEVPVGHITMGIGHAPLNAGARPAAEHYDNTEAVVADVASGEDEYGIWFAGALRPDMTEDRIEQLRAASLSGDWRQIGGSLELIAALAVNVPGFPVPRIGLAASGSDQTSLVACGVIEREAGATVLDGNFAREVAEEILAVQDEQARKLAARRRINDDRKLAATTVIGGDDEGL